MSDVNIGGEVKPGFEKVRDAFENNFAQHGDVGAAFSLYVKGEKVVDLWGGTADVSTSRPWEQDTLQLFFSTTKGVAAICAHLLAQRGELDLDAPIANYWPEFKAEGKENITVRQGMSHRAGIPVVDVDLTPEQVCAWDPIVEALAAQKPIWEPGTKHGYHALTYGWIVGEIVKRVTGKSLGTFYRDEIGEPLGLDLWIGLPESEESRVAPLVILEAMTAEGPSQEVLDSLPEEMRRMILAFTDPNSITQRALNVAKPSLDFNSRMVHAAEIPAANGISDARSLAKIYAACVGEVDGIRILEPKQVDDALVEQSNGPDEVLMVPTRFGTGFFLNGDFAPLFSDRSFGHAGAGGSLGFADADAQIGFGYVMNKMQTNLSGDPRTLTLIKAVRESL
jgi:CubicO group peptidase (beta-lactamase class C family)